MLATLTRINTQIFSSAKLIFASLRQFAVKAEKRPEPSASESLRAIVCASWANVLLVFIPISWALHFAKPEEDTLIFCFSFLGIIPLAQLLSFATEDMSLRLGQTLAGLLNATLGNAVELIVAIIALTKCELGVVQASLIGSILSNLLLVLGMCFFVGGTRFSEQGFSSPAANINSSLLSVSVVAILVPAVLYFSTQAFQDPGSTTTVNTNIDASSIVKISRGVSIILLAVYCCYIAFQLWTHSRLFKDDIIEQKTVPYVKRTSQLSMAESGGADSVTTEEEPLQMNIVVAMALLVVVTVLVSVSAEFLVDSINGLVQSTGISPAFVALILIPIAGNAAEHVTAVTVSYKDKLTLSISVAVGSSIQIALFVIPFIVTVGWVLGKPMTLLFDPFQSIVLLLSVLTVNYCVQDGKSNWLEGVILMALYCIVAVATWFYNGIDVAGMLTTCT